MQLNYLIVTRWKKDNLKLVWSKIKRVTAIGKRARKLAEQYERDLNGGHTGRELWEKGNFNPCYTVCPIPWSQARECNNIKKWEHSPFYSAKLRREKTK